MTQHSAGTIAALQYAQRPALDFTDIVEEFDIAFQDGSFSQRSLKWDCEDVAIFDRETVRVALGWMQPETEGQPWYLIVAVGAAPDADDAPLTREFCEELAAHILERTGEYLPYDAVLRSEADGTIDAELIDRIADRIQSAGRPSQSPEEDADFAEAFADALPGTVAQWAADTTETVTETDAAAEHSRPDETPGKTATPSWMEHFRARVSGDAKPADDHDAAQASVPEFDLGGLSGLAPESETEEMRDLREALCGTTPETEISPPMHLSIYALGATMLLQAPPVGAALLVYTVLREDLHEAA